MEPESSSPYPQVTAIRPYSEPTPSSFAAAWYFLWKHSPPGDPSGGVVYLRIVFSPEEASQLMGIS